jgi:hypothetical protein
MIKLADICTRIGVNPRRARETLRASGITKYTAMWVFTEEQVPIVTELIKRDAAVATGGVTIPRSLAETLTVSPAKQSRKPRKEVNRVDHRS